MVFRPWRGELRRVVDFARIAGSSRRGTWHCLTVHTCMSESGPDHSDCRQNLSPAGHQQETEANDNASGLSSMPCTSSPASSSPTKAAVGVGLTQADAIEARYRDACRSQKYQRSDLTICRDGLSRGVRRLKASQHDGSYQRTSDRRCVGNGVAAGHRLGLRPSHPCRHDVHNDKRKKSD